ARPSKASPPAAALARAGEVSLQNPARPTAVEASPPFSSGTKRPRQDARRSNSDRRRRPSAESGHAESFDRSLSVSSQRFEVPCALDPSGALCKFSAWHTSLCHAGSPIRRNLPTRHFSRDRALLPISRRHRYGHLLGRNSRLIGLGQFVVEHGLCLRLSRLDDSGVPGTPYLTAWPNSGKSERERALRLKAIRQAS